MAPQQEQLVLEAKVAATGTLTTALGETSEVLIVRFPI